MNPSIQVSAPAVEVGRRVQLAQRAYRDFFAQCFWSYRPDWEITPDKIPFVIRGLREHGGQAGYRMAAELCR